MEGAAPANRLIPDPRPANPLPDADGLRWAFDAAPEFTVGIEDEILLLDPETLELAPVGQELVERCEEYEPFKLELPASQLEITPPPVQALDALEDALAALRRRVVELGEGLAVPAAAGAHPFSEPTGALNFLPRYHQGIEEYGTVATRQLVCALQVHVAVGDAAVALAVYNTARIYLPLIAALAANAPVYEGRDTGLASVRPQICRLLPRQGVPPPLEDWEALAAAYRWGAEAGAFPTPQSWWWELRPHPAFGTLEFRVPDGQSDLRGAIAVAAVVQCLVVWLAERHKGGEAAPMIPTWQIEENRWSACRHGVEGTMADPVRGQRVHTREALHELLEQLAPVAERLGSARGLEHARELVERNGAIVQREVFRDSGPQELVRWLAGRFLERSHG